MKKLMTSTALVAFTSMGTVAYADMHDHASDAVSVPAFLLSDFTGKDLYVLDTDATRSLTENRMDDERSLSDRARLAWESADVFSGDRDDWDNIGSISDVVMTQDGEVRGVLIDVGGFLGLGARTVMVEMDSLYFVADEGTTDDIDDFFVVAPKSREALESLPEFDEDSLSFTFAAQSQSSPELHSGAQMDASAQHASDAQMVEQVDDETARTELPAGYEILAVEDRTVDRLLGADVYGREGEEIASVDDLIIGANEEITHLIMDVGGFLGIGEHTVSLSVQDVDILWNDENNDVRVQVTMTQEEMESLPEYDG